MTGSMPMRFSSFLMGIFLFSILCYISVLTVTVTERTVADDWLNRSTVMNDSGSLVSAGGVFRLGFFTAGNSRNRYLRIWYNHIPDRTIVWVANRNNPLNDSLGVLKIAEDGNLVIVDRAGRVAWSTGIQNMSSTLTVAQLLDSGNLVLRGEDSKGMEDYIWQSFDHPTDTLIAGMKLGWDLRISMDRYLTSWRTADDPATGEFSLGIDLFGLPQSVVRKRSIKQFRTGPWNGVQFSGTKVESSLFNATFVDNLEEVYYEYGLYEDLSIVVMNYSGKLQRNIWNNKSLEWVVLSSYPNNDCDNYGFCGPNSICKTYDPQLCRCLDGYIPKSPEDWDEHTWKDGCIPKHPFNCSEREGFVKIERVTVPDLLQVWVNADMTLKECELECFKNCFCSAYANSNASEGGSGCLLWYGDLIDMRSSAEAVEVSEQNLHIRVTDRGTILFICFLNIAQSHILNIIVYLFIFLSVHLNDSFLHKIIPTKGKRIFKSFPQFLSTFPSNQTKHAQNI
ncbi:hypothetical protein NMG60_11012548 [Bertholletia excelsa]